MPSKRAIVFPLSSVITAEYVAIFGFNEVSAHSAVRVPAVADLTYEIWELIAAAAIP